MGRIIGDSHRFSSALAALKTLDPKTYGEVTAIVGDAPIHLLPEMMKDTGAIDSYEKSREAEKSAWLYVERETMVA